MSENTNLTYHQRNRDVILNRSKDYYGNDKERLHGKNRYLNMFEEKKQRLKEYQKNYREVRRSHYNNCDIIIIQ